MSAHTRGRLGYLHGQMIHQTQTTVRPLVPLAIADTWASSGDPQRDPFISALTNYSRHSKLCFRDQFA